MLLLVFLIVVAQSCTALLNVSLDSTSCAGMRREVTRHTSHVTRHTSHVTRHTSLITCFSMRSASPCSVLLLLWMRSSLACRAFQLRKEHRKAVIMKASGSSGPSTCSTAHSLSMAASSDESLSISVCTVPRRRFSPGSAR